MVVSVCKSEINPYYNLFEESEAGFLSQSKPLNFSRRQDAPNTYFYNGAIYVINIATLLQKPLNQFKKICFELIDHCVFLYRDSLFYISRT